MMPGLKEDKLRSLFTIAGIAIVRLWELPNQYWPRVQFEEGREGDFLRYHQLREGSPWWLVRTRWGMIEVGARKRVLSINWHDTGLCAKDLTADDVSKGDYFVHAWSDLKAAEYLTALAARLQRYNPLPPEEP